MHVALQNISVNFGSLVALDDVSVEFTSGEIHALVGENGAGKSTAMAVLFGMQQDYRGTITKDNKNYAWSSPRDAINAGIGMVHQHFMLQDSMSVLENVIIGSELTNKLGVVKFNQAQEIVEKLASQAGLNAKLSEPVANLSVGERQLVEIIKQLYREAQLLILDEPTAVLTPHERDQLFSNLQKFRDENKAIILITHKIDEVMQIADRVSILRKGKLVKSCPLKETNRVEIEEAIIGDKLPQPVVRAQHPNNDKVLELQDVEIQSEFATRKKISFSVYTKEIVGIAGVAGNGQAQLVEAITGLKHQVSGNISLHDKNINSATIRRRRELGMSYIPEDRQRRGLALEAELAENVCVTKIKQDEFSNKGFLKTKRMHDYASELIDKFTIKAPSSNSLVSTLSGGNKQKVVLARELSSSSSLLVVENPTWGVDIGASNFIYEQLIQKRDEGCAVLLISTDLDEIMTIADRIYVMSEGGISESINIKDATTEILGRLMLAKHTSNQVQPQVQPS